MENKVGELGHYLKPSEVQRRLGISRGTLEALIENEGFPKPIKFSAKTNRFREQDVIRWVESNENGEGQKLDQVG